LAIWNILGFILVLVYCTKKNLTILVETHDLTSLHTTSVSQLDRKGVTELLLLNDGQGPISKA
jgi:hypothetical protein